MPGQWSIQPGAYPSFWSMKQLEVFLLPPGMIQVHQRVTSSITFASTNLYTWGKRHCDSLVCNSQEHNATTPARVQIWTTHDHCTLTIRLATTSTPITESCIILPNKMYTCPVKSFSHHSFCACGSFGTDSLSFGTKPAFKLLKLDSMFFL